MRLVVEGAGAAGVAALMAGKVKLRAGEKVGTPLCGGNIDGNLLTRVLERVMVKQGRYLMIKMLIDDVPGTLSTLSTHVARMGANIIEVVHRRAFWLVPLSKVGIELVMEVRSHDHGQAVISALEGEGYTVMREIAGESWQSAAI